VAQLSHNIGGSNRQCPFAFECPNGSKTVLRKNA